MSTGAFQATVGTRKVYCVPYFPVGFIIEMNKNTNPSIYFGGTWKLYGVGCVTACIDTTDTDTNVKTSFNQAVGTEIGSKYLQSHKHHYYSPIVQLVQSSTSGGTYGNYQKQYKIDTDSTGSGDAQNIQPTVLVYRWVKTAD